MTVEPLTDEEQELGYDLIRQMEASSPLLWAAKHARIVHPELGVLPFVPYPYQARFLVDRSKRRIAVKARQVGMSATIAIESCHKAIFRPNRTILFVSRNERLAGELNGYCKATLVPLHQSGYLASIGIRIRKQNETEIWLSNGSRIISLPANDQTARGFAASDVYLDEQAFHRYAEEIYQSVEGSVSLGGTVTILSTPKGKTNKFARIYHGMEGGEDWSRHRIHFSECPTYDAEWERKKRAEMTIEGFAEEYDCDFVASGDTVFDSDDVDQMAVDYNPDAAEEYVTAWDIARRKDWTVGSTWGLTQGTWHLVDFERFRAPYPVIQKRIEDRYDKYPGVHLVESNGVGDPVIENTLRPVKPYLTTAKSKRNAIESLQILIQKGRIKARNLQLNTELKSYEWDDEDLVQDFVMSAAIAATEMPVDFAESWVTENDNEANVPEFKGLEKVF